MSRKPHENIDVEVCSLDHLKKVKEGYTDQFNIDFNELMQVIHENEDVLIHDTKREMIRLSKAEEAALNLKLRSESTMTVDTAIITRAEKV